MKKESKKKAAVVIEAAPAAKEPLAPIVVVEPKAPRPSGALVIAPNTTELQLNNLMNEWLAKKSLIIATVAPNLNDTEFELFLHVAKAKRLDPLQRQVHAVKRKSWDDKLNGYVERMTIQTGIDGYRAIANRTGLYMPSEKEPLVEGSGTPELRIKFYVLKWSPLDKQYHEYNATAYYREYVQTFKKDNKVKPTSMWEKMPINQLTKCAEALALRKGWPEELGGMYVPEEMQHQDEVKIDPKREVARGDAPAAVNAPEQGKTPVGAVGASQVKQQQETLSESTGSPNRGHGKEGTQQQHTMDTTVEEVIPKVKNIVKNGKKTGEQRYLALRCSGDVFVYVWDDKLKEAANATKGKQCILIVSLNKTATKEYLSLQEVEVVGGRAYKRGEDGVARPVPSPEEITDDDTSFAPSEEVSGVQLDFNS
jgi:phage recombination protein Bet